MSAQPSVLSVADVHVEPGLNARAVEEDELEGLTASTARHGVLQPQLVRGCGKCGAWLVAGHRRLTAARAAGLSEVPVVLVDGESPRAHRGREPANGRIRAGLRALF
jgi:ParB family chromosome partitioning protein